MRNLKYTNSPVIRRLSLIGLIAPLFLLATTSQGGSIRDHYTHPDGYVSKQDLEGKKFDWVMDEIGLKSKDITTGIVSLEMMMCMKMGESMRGETRQVRQELQYRINTWNQLGGYLIHRYNRNFKARLGGVDVDRLKALTLTLGSNLEYNDLHQALFDEVVEDHIHSKAALVNCIQTLPTDRRTAVDYYKDWHRDVKKVLRTEIGSDSDEINEVFYEMFEDRDTPIVNALRNIVCGIGESGSVINEEIRRSVGELGCSARGAS